MDDLRIGFGYDIHKLVENRKLVLGGVIIDYEKGLLGHSDADVLVHAIIDSLLGASNNSNIGVIFPDNDDKYKDANSIDLLVETKKILKKSSFYIINIDCVIVAQNPKLNKYIQEMKKNISKALEIDASRISIKPKTNEELDSVGQGNAISSYATCLICQK